MDVTGIEDKKMLSEEFLNKTWRFCRYEQRL